MSTEKAYNILLLGPSGVGKSSIISFFIRQRIEKNLTLGIEVYSAKYNDNVILHFFDTNDPFQQYNLIQRILSLIDGVFIVFDVNNLKTLTLAYNIYLTYYRPELNFIFLGNKCDSFYDKDNLEIKRNIEKCWINNGNFTYFFVTTKYNAMNDTIYLHNLKKSLKNIFKRCKCNDELPNNISFDLVTENLKKKYNVNRSRRKNKNLTKNKCLSCCKIL